MITGSDVLQLFENLQKTCKKTIYRSQSTFWFWFWFFDRFFDRFFLYILGVSLISKFCFLEIIWEIFIRRYGNQENPWFSLLLRWGVGGGGGGLLIHISK